MAFTYFFRDLQTMEVIVDNLLPAVSGQRNIRIWDAGCASGQEPYTMAILLAEKMNQYAFRNLKITATDIDISNQFEKVILEGIYPFDQLKRIPEKIFKKYFKEIEKEKYQISLKIRDRIEYRRENLLDLKSPGNGFSLILCKNVLLHQSYDQRIEIIQMFHKALNRGGFMAMEQTQKLPEECSSLFEAAASNAQIFKKKGG